MAKYTTADYIDMSGKKTLPTGLELSQYGILLSCLTILAFIGILIFRIYSQDRDGLKAPYIGYRSVFEPAWLVRLRFSYSARPMINDGYQKVKFNMKTKVSRNDKDLLVIANKYVDELRALPNEKLSSIEALITNIVGKYSASTIMLESSLPTRILQTKLTPNLANFTDAMKDELDYSLATDFPECDDWTPVQIYQIILKVIARISNRIFVSEPICRNEEWIKMGLEYSDSVTLTVMILRCVPPMLHPVIAMLLPSAWRVQSSLRKAKQFLTPIINARREAEKNQSQYQKPTDVLQWMMDAADIKERRPENLTHRLMILVLGSVHTTTMAASHALYDMSAMPEYFAPLRVEIRDALEHGAGWRKSTISKMLKLDSFLKESQRLSPASLLGFHRIVQTPLTLSDGTHLPKGSHLCVASAAVATDPANFPDHPNSFHGFRYSDKRQSSPEEANKHQFAMTDRNHLHFGNGRHACPGRFFASYELKMVLAELLLRYEFRYPEGKRRPENLNADEFLYADPSTVLEMKRRVGKAE